MTDRAMVALVRRDAPVPFSDEVQTRAYELWSTVAGRNASATRRLLMQEGMDEAIPTDQTIRNWARDYGWAQRADLEIRETAGRSLYELRMLTWGLILQSQQVKLNLMTGAYDDDPHAGAMAAKGAELTDKWVERVLPQGLLAGLLTPSVDANQSEDELSVEEREARIRARVKEAKRG